MKRGELQQEWSGMSEEILEGVAQWREQHPRATMREIEEEIDKRLSELRAKMISDAANASERAKWDTTQAAEIARLKRENERLHKRLEQAELIIKVQKKSHRCLGL
jgi:predicted mannosyl-3-phosphoglycerate phosphatase (HAD superfamily)